MNRFYEEKAKLASRQGNEQLAIEFELKRLAAYKAMPAKQAKHKRRLISSTQYQLGNRYAKMGEFDIASTYLDQSLSSWSNIYERNTSDITARRSLVLIHTEMARLFWNRAVADNDYAQRSQACEHYQKSIQMLNQMDDPMARFPTRHQGSPAPREIYAEAAQRCDE